MNRPNLVVALLFGAGALVAGVITAIGVAAGRPDFLISVLFVVLAAGAVDGFSRRTVTGRYGRAYLVAFAVFAAATAVGLLAGGSVVGGAVLLTIAAGAAVLALVEARRRRRAAADAMAEEEPPVPGPPRPPA